MTKIKCFNLKKLYSIILIGFIVFGCEEEDKYIPTYPPSEFQKRLVGNWTGDAELLNEETWKIDITFTESGHYIASAYDFSNIAELASPFLFGFKRVEDAEGGYVLLPPSPDIPCQSFIIDYVLNMKGYGTLSIGREYEIGGEIDHYFCSEPFEIKNLEFTNGGDELIFDLAFWEGPGSDWYIKYKLNKVE